mgnify:CR=1 FL=1
MRFQFQYEYSLKDLEALSRVTGKLYRRWKNWIYRILLAVLTVGYLVLGVLAFAGGGWIPGLILIWWGSFLALSRSYTIRDLPGDPGGCC